MSSAKSAVNIASKAQYINIPKIGHPKDYVGWLQSLLKTPHNRKVFLTTEKNEADHHWRSQATQTFKHDNNQLKKALEIMNSASSKSDYAKKKAHLKITYSASGDLNPADVLPDNMTALSLPMLAMTPGVNNRSNDSWVSQTYEAFAKQIEQNNPGTTFTKEIMDAAFQTALNRKAAGCVNHKAKESMVSRCLGKESTKYWKNR